MFREETIRTPESSQKETQLQPQEPTKGLTGGGANAPVDPGAAGRATHYREELLSKIDTEQLSNYVTSLYPETQPARSSADGASSVMRSVSPFQQSGEGGFADDGPRNVSDIARSGFSGFAGPLPYRSQLEQSFGRDLSGVKAFRGTESTAAAESLGANAYAYDGAVVLGGRSDLRTVAEETAHVLQMGGSGAGPSSEGLTSPNSAQEIEAGSIADSVVSGATVGPLSTSLGNESIARSSHGGGGGETTLEEEETKAMMKTCRPWYESAAIELAKAAVTVGLTTAAIGVVGATGLPALGIAAMVGGAMGMFWSAGKIKNAKGADRIKEAALAGIAGAITGCIGHCAGLLGAKLGTLAEGAIRGGTEAAGHGAGHGAGEAAAHGAGYWGGKMAAKIPTEAAIEGPIHHDLEHRTEHAADTKKEGGGFFDQVKSFLGMGKKKDKEGGSIDTAAAEAAAQKKAKSEAAAALAAQVATAKAEAKKQYDDFKKAMGVGRTRVPAGGSVRGPSMSNLRDSNMGM